MQGTSWMAATGRAAALILTFTPAAAGCDDQAAAPGLRAVASHDSGGVLHLSLADVVEGGIPDLPAFVEPATRIDGGDEPLFGVVAAFQLPGGNGDGIAVVDRGSHAIRVFGRDGSEVRRLGGTGDGPGEFRDLTAAGRLADSVWAFDFLAQRLTVFGPDGAVRTVRVETDLPFRTLVGHLGREFVAIESPVTTPATESGLRRDSLELALVSGDDGRVRPLGRFNGDEILVEVEPRSGGGVSVSKSRLAEAYATEHAVVDDRLATVETERYRLELRGADGALRRAVEADLRGRPVDSEYHARGPVADGLLAGFSRDGRPAAWLRLATAPDDSLATWIAHGTQGEVIDGARLPAGLRLTDATTGRFIGVEVDELGVERVAVFERRDAR